MMTDAQYARFCLRLPDLAKHHKLKDTGSTCDYRHTIYEGAPASVSAFCEDLDLRGRSYVLHAPGVIWVS